ncbi:MAG: right-handed parallel beta-helix repeat-containing protein [Candidatus Heimdallarchaeota archaeon]|nr:right-handed parallel beta-helix repeat-containing protein [Candidatus Heimdallarchaeota archaeon]MBY8994219.1 right-handed parallel beta-helix repeat-containing protein [Candidatus Heimdallarchaeota archaeon]
MKRNVLIGIIISILVLSIFSVAIYFNLKDELENNNGDDLEQIIITKDSDFTEKYHFQGNGTSLSPYIIENLTISTKLEIAIGIYNVNSVFVIQKCSITARRFCIYLFNITEPGCIISDNVCAIDTRNVYGPEGVAIEINKSNGVLVFNNNCFTEFYFYDNVGILLNKSSFCDILNNTCSNFDIGISQTFMNSGWGVWSYDHPINNTIKGNYCFENQKGIYSFGSGFAEIIDNYCFYNSRGIEVSHLLSYENQTTKIRNNTCIFNYNGIKATSLPLAEISGNNCSFNDAYGIQTYKCYGNITRNTCQGNENGLIFSTQNCSVFYNDFIDNKEYGVLTSDTAGEKWIFLNNFINNNLDGTEHGSAQAYDKDSDYLEDNINWYNPITLIGNYWSELIWDDEVIYVIDGGFNLDPYPVQYPINI